MNRSTGTSLDHDRHPKIGRGAFLACKSTVLGNIQVGAGATVGAQAPPLPHSLPWDAPRARAGQRRPSAVGSRQQTGAGRLHGGGVAGENAAAQAQPNQGGALWGPAAARHVLRGLWSGHGHLKEKGVACVGVCGEGTGTKTHEFCAKSLWRQAVQFTARVRKRSGTACAPWRWCRPHAARGPRERARPPCAQPLGV